MLKKKDKIETDDIDRNIQQDTQSILDLYSRPHICFIDIDNNVVESIKSRGFSIETASLGTPISVKNESPYSETLCLLNHDFPANIHEFDIFVIDMKTKEPIPYNQSANIRENQKDIEAFYFLTQYPQTIFEPRSYTASVLRDNLSNIKDRPYVLIIFASDREEDKYKIVNIKDRHNNYAVNYDNYSFLSNSYFEKNISGNKIEIVSENNYPFSKELSSLFNGIKGLFKYESIFFDPKIQPNSNKIFMPLMINLNKEIVSYFNYAENEVRFVLPQIKEKEKILIPFFEEMLPSIIPDMFPDATRFAWKDNEDYWLPNQKDLIEEKAIIEKEYKEKIENIDLRINENLTQYSFLHDLITETDEKLVDAVKEYFKWIGFEDVKKMDSEDKLKEEDLQIQLENGILVIEIKGIGGTSKDNECSQISKIKHRRCKERNAFDVCALYIVNHQRHLPPKQRTNPPFTEVQITDAETDERGLLTTWNLFKEYFNIINGITTKENFRERITDYGLVGFLPNNLKLIGQIKEVLKNGTVMILDIEDVCIKTNDIIMIEHKGELQKVTVLNIQANSNDVSEATSGEIGFLVDKKIKKNSNVYISIQEKIPIKG